MTPYSYLLSLFFVFVYESCFRGVLAEEKALKCVYSPRSGSIGRYDQNDITWWLEKVSRDGTVTSIAQGSGPSNVLSTPVRLTANETDCFRYRITDAYGDGGGWVDVYWGDDPTPSLTFENDATSDEYNAGLGGGYEGTFTKKFQNGVSPPGGSCWQETGCHEEIAADIIFVLDTASDLSTECEHFYWDDIINLVENYVPRSDLQIAVVTYGSDESDLTASFTPVLRRGFATVPTDNIPTQGNELKGCAFTSSGSWFNYLKPLIAQFKNSECVGGDHSTISALVLAVKMYVAEYAQVYTPTRKQYLILVTDGDINVDETKNVYPCEYFKTTFEENAIEFILVSTGDTANPSLSCLVPHDENIVLLDNFGANEYYETIQDLVCSSEIEVAITEIFIDDENNRYFVEIVNLGRPFNMSELVFSGNLLAGGVDSNAIIAQGDLFVIGNMNTADDDTPCSIYGGTIVSDDNNFDCTNYYSSIYDGSATLDSFSLTINDKHSSTISVSSSDSFVIEPMYSYELNNIHRDFTDLSNWRESCYRYGSPGKFTSEFCIKNLCDPVKCTYLGDTDAVCSNNASCTTVQTEATTNNWVGDWEFCYPSTCSCGKNYFYDANITRSCIDIPPVPSCYAYVTSPDTYEMEITWELSEYETQTKYKIYYGGESTTVDITGEQGITIMFADYEIDVVSMSVKGKDPGDGTNKLSAQTTCSYGFAPTKRPTRPGETYSPSLTPTLSPVTTAHPSIPPTASPTFAGCGSSLRLDLMIILDSSGSVYNRDDPDNRFIYWYQELNFVKTIINGSLPGDSRVGVINFSGCGTSKSYNECRWTDGQLIRMWGLLDFGLPNDQQALYDRFALIDSSDFLGGKTWTDEALGIALAEFQANSTSGRQRMILLLTDGEPYPYDAGHDPCEVLTPGDPLSEVEYSDNLLALRALDVTLLAVGIGLSDTWINKFFKCIVTDFDEHFFPVSDFSALDTLVEGLNELICSSGIELIINEVGLLTGCVDYTQLANNGSLSGETLFFVELYNAGIGVSLAGFKFSGMINYEFTESGYGVDQYQYWVLSTFNMSTVLQSDSDDLGGCRGCGQDLLITPPEDYIDSSMDDDWWTLTLEDALGNVIDTVTRDPYFFPRVDKCYTHELQWEDYDNSFGGNWEESCYVFGTPQDPNQEPCPCTSSKCQSRGDLTSYCGAGSDRFGIDIPTGVCICHSNYIASGGVCVPVYAPDCCFAWEEDCSSGSMLLTWCAPPTDAVRGYTIYIDDVELDSVGNNITEYWVSDAICNVNDGTTTNYSVTTIFQETPLIESAKTLCPPTPPTKAPTTSPSQSPTDPTHEPTAAPTTKEPTTAEPTNPPTPFTCVSLTILLRSDNYSAAVNDLGGTYTLASSTINEDKWKWEKENPTSANDVIEYVDSHQSWTLSSGFTFLVYDGDHNDSSSQLPPYSQSIATGYWTNWTDTFTGERVEAMLLCEQPPTWRTPHPTPSPVTEPPAPPMPNCTILYVSSTGKFTFTDKELSLSSTLRDGRGFWAKGTSWEIAWIDRIQRWTLYKVKTDELFLAPLAMSSLAEPLSDTPTDWVYIADDTEIASLTVRCYYNTTTSTTPAPTVFEPCSFPDAILHRWHLGALEHWQKCYETTYSDGTTTDILQEKCLQKISDEYDNDLSGVYIFVGAVDEVEDPNYAYLGAYAHINVLQTTTDSLYTAQQTSMQYPDETWWYFVPNVAFGFSDSKEINLAGGGCDINDLSSRKRLCWHLLNSATGGWRAGTQYDLNYATNMNKVIYYKQCNVTVITTPAPTLGVCETITVYEDDGVTVLTTLNDYGVVNDYKYSWQDTAPDTNTYELGWLGVKKAWLFDTVEVDGKIWLFEDPAYDPTFPPFDVVTTWYNRDNTDETMNLTLTCDPQYNGTHAPSPPPSICDCINVTAPGLSAIEGFYNYSDDPRTNDGGTFIRFDGMRVYYDTDIETWMIVGNGAYFELNGTLRHGTHETQTPPLDTWLVIIDRVTLNTAKIKFECSLVCPSPQICPTYDIWEYVDAEIIYTTLAQQIGFPTDPTKNDADESFDRPFDEFLYSRSYYESTLQLSISDYILDGDATIGRYLYQPKEIQVVYDSLDEQVYRDSNTIGLWYQLRDEYDSTYLNLDGVSIKAYANSVYDTLDIDCNTTSYAIDNETGFNWIKCELLFIPDDWFITSGTEDLTIYAELYIDDALISTSNVIDLILAARIEAEGIDFPGIFGEFAMSPRYATDEVRLDLWLQSDNIKNIASSLFRNRYAQAWWISMTFDNAVLEYIDFIPYDDIWGSIRTLYTKDETNENGYIEIWGSKIGQLLTTNGPNITVGYFVFEVLSDVADGTYSNVLSFNTLSMSGDNGYSITTNVGGLMADIYGWSTLEASLVVIPDDPIEIFVEVDTNNLWNTAFISGLSVSIPFPIYVVYHFQITRATSLACGVDAQYRKTMFPAVTLAESLCEATTTSTHTEYGIVPMNITADGITSTQFVSVWLPLLSSFEIEPWNTGALQVQYNLDELDMAYRAVGDRYFESLPVYVYCTFTNGDVTTSRVSVNEFLEGCDWVFADDTFAEIVHNYDQDIISTRYVLRGLAQGATELNLTLASKSRVFGSIDITVGASIVGIEGFGGILVTHSEFENESQLVNISDPLTSVTNLRQYLANVGDIGSVHPFVKLADGVLIDLSDDENVVYNSTFPDFLRLINVDKSSGANMDEAGAYVQVTPIAEQVKWTELVLWNWISPDSIAGVTRSRGLGCIPGAINRTDVLSVNASLACDTRQITRIQDPADYIFGIPVECYLIVKVYWSDGTVTDMSTDNRTVYKINTENLNNLLSIEDTNVARANISCDINTNFTEQNPKCYGFDTISVSFIDYPKLVNWTDSVEIEVVIFDRLRLRAYPYPDYDNSSAYEPATILNPFVPCAPDYEQAVFRIWGNLTSGEDRELTAREDIILNDLTSTGSVSLSSDDRLASGQTVGTESIGATLAGTQQSVAGRDDYTSNTVEVEVVDDQITLDVLDLYTFADREQVFEDLINTRELLKIDATFSDGVIIRDILREMVDGNLWTDTNIADVFSFNSTDPLVVSVDENGYVELLDNWWRGVNITVTSKCSDAVTQELIYPNLKPDYWDVDVEEPETDTGLQFENQDYGATNDPFLWNIYINATTGTLLSFSVRLWWDDNLFIENGTNQCSYFWDDPSTKDAWPQCHAAGDWEGQMVSWNIDTVRGELRLAGASSTGSSTNNSLQHVATCNMRVRNQSESNITNVVGQIIEISYLDSSDHVIKHVYNQAIVAGDGYQQINNGQTIKPLFPENIQNRLETERDISYECSASSGAEYLFNGDSASCCDYPLFGDTNYDCRHTAFDAQAITYYFIDSSGLYPTGFNTIALDSLAWSQRIAMDQSLDYLQDDRNECVNQDLSNPCTQGLEDVWYSLQVQTGKFLYLNLTHRNQSLRQETRIVRAIAPMFIEEFSNVFRYATDLDATVFFELRGLNAHNKLGFIGNNSLAIGELIPPEKHGINASIIIEGEYIDEKYWTFETNEYEWEDGDCFEMAILYETYSEDDGIIHSYDSSVPFKETIAKEEDQDPLNCTQIDREYAFRGSKYFGDSFIKFTELCLSQITSEPTSSPTPPPTSSPTVEWTGPEITDCRYEDHGTAILAFFNMETNRAGFGGQPFSCLSVWNPVSFNDIEGVTQDSRCIWKDFSTMRIELGYEFGMRPTYQDESYRLILGGDNVRDYAEGTPPARGYCIVYPMFNPPPVFASIIGATHLSKCEDLRLLASPTTGQAAPMQWLWEITGSELQNGCELGSDAIPNDEEILLIPNECLTQSGKSELYFYISLTATNHYLENFNYDASQHTTERTIILYPSAIKKPTIELLTPTVVNITSEQDLIIPTFVRVDSGGNCNEDEWEYDIDQFSFEWETLTYFGDIFGQDGYNPFGSDWSDSRLEDGDFIINENNFEEMDPSSTSSTLLISGTNFEVGKYYGFKVTVTYISSGQTNAAYVGVVVNLPIPYPRPSIMYQAIHAGNDITVDINNLYDFYDQDPTSYGIEWDCFNGTTSVLHDASSFDGDTEITINEANADLLAGTIYNCSAHLYSLQRNTFNITWGRQESYFVFEYVNDDISLLIQQNDTNKIISVSLTTNIGTISTNKRIVISATMYDYYRTRTGLDWDEYYTYEWTNFGENYDLEDNVYGISVIDHLEYEQTLNKYTVNFVVDAEVGRFIFDGQKMGFQLKVIANEQLQNEVYSGYGRIELIANRGPNGGQCVVDLYDEYAMMYRVECYGWTDEYMELPIEYNFMLLTKCKSDSTCPGEQVCDKSSEYDYGVCVLSTVGPVQNYMREWTQGTRHYFKLKHSEAGLKKYIMRSFVRDYAGFVTTFDTKFKVQPDEQFTTKDAIFNEFFVQLEAAQELSGTAAFGQYITAMDVLLDYWGGANRTDIGEQIDLLYYKLISKSKNDLLDRFYDFNKIYSTFFDTIYFDDDQFWNARLSELTASSPNKNVAHRTMKIIRDMWRYFKFSREGADGKMIPRDLSVYELTAMTWAGDAALQQTDLNTLGQKWNSLKNKYFKFVLGMNDIGLNERLVDETHYNVSYDGLMILSGWETHAKLFSDDSDCGGDLIDLAPDYYVSYFGGEQVDYVKCELVSFNGGILTPTAVSEYMSSPIIYWKLSGYLKDGTLVPNGGFSRRRLVEFGDCSPFLYQVPHNPDTNLLNYGDRRSQLSKQTYVPWSVCKSILEISNDTEANPDISSADNQAPTAENCYVLTHDEKKTVCACKSNYTLLAVEEELYYPKFVATLHRYNPDWSWDGLMISVGAMLWVLILLFVFTFAFYLLPSYDKHKALLAVKKGLPKSQREGAYFQTAEGKVFRAARINMNGMSFCQVYCAVYKIRLRNDHACLWWCCDDPGSNISHFIKVLLTLFYCLLFLVQLAWFYGKEHETQFPDTLFAFLIAFETILPIWLCAWCISKIRPHEFTDEEIDELVQDQMPIITKDQKWEDEYESDIEHGDGEEMDEGDEAGGFFAVPGIHENLKEEQNNWDILRVYTDIDEEIEYLEENYMPDEAKWQKKKRKIYPLAKVGYVPLEDDEEESSSLDSHEERRGFEGQKQESHYGQARDAAKLGFIPVNEEEEYDPVASKMLRENQKEQLKQKRKERHEREGSISSRLSSLFRRDASEGGSKEKKKKEKKEKKRRRSSLMQLLSFGSKKDVIEDDIGSERSKDKSKDRSKDRSRDSDREKKPYKKVKKREPSEESDEANEEEFESEEEFDNDEQYYSDENNDDEDEEEYEEEYEESEESEEEEDETSSERRRRRKKEKKRAKRRKEKKRPMAAMDAPRPMQKSGDKKRRKKHKHKQYVPDNDEKAIEMEERHYTKSEAETGEWIAAHLSSSRKYIQFNKILQIGRVNREKIARNPKLLKRIVNNAIASGDTSLVGSENIVKRVQKLIKQKHALFEEIERGATDENQQRIQKLLRKQDVLNTVFAPIDGGRSGGPAGNLAYSPAELRKLEELPERAPSQRPQQEKKTNIDDDIWDQADLAYGQRDIDVEDKRDKKGKDMSGKGIDLDDIWEVTGALPPDLMQALEDPYDPWKENELKPIQKPLRDDQEEDYRDKLTNHFKKRRELLQRKYWLPRWCRYVVWILLIICIIIFLWLFLLEGNKLGAAFLWIPDEMNNTQCTISITEQERFDYDFSLDEAKRRNPACSPQECEGSMDHCWDYRVRFTIASIITCLTSILLVQPLYIAILALIAVTCLPICKPACVACRNWICCMKKDDPGYKHFLGGTILISGDTNLEYGQLADEHDDMTAVSELSRDERRSDNDDDDDDDYAGARTTRKGNETKETPLLDS